MFGNVLLTDLIGRYIPLIYLIIPNDFNVIHTYSWRFAILACLYKHLCLTCMKGVKQVIGYLLLLHV